MGATSTDGAFFVQVDYISGEVHDEVEAKHARIWILEIASGKHWVRPAGSEKKNGLFSSPLSRADLWHGDDAHAGRRVFHCMYQRSDHLRECNQSEAPCAFASRRYQRQQQIDGSESIRPAAAGSENIPGPKNRRIHLAQAYQFLALRSNLDVCLHDRCGLRHADINKMLHACMFRSVDGPATSQKVHAAKLCGFERIGGAQLPPIAQKVSKV